MSETLEKSLNELTYAINRLEGLWRLNYENGIKQQAESQSFLVDHQKRVEAAQQEGHKEILGSVEKHIDDKITENMARINKHLMDQLALFSQTVHMLEQKMDAQAEAKRLSDSFAKRLMNGFKKG